MDKNPHSHSAAIRGKANVRLTVFGGAEMFFSLMRQARLRPAGKPQQPRPQCVINRKRTRTSDHQKTHNGEHQEVELKSLALLCTCPVHEKAIRTTYGC